MKQIFFLITVLLSMMAAGLSSCKSDDNDNPVNPDKKYYLERADIDYGNNWSGSNRDIVYDKEGRVTSITQVNIGNDMYWKYEYSSSRIVSWTKFEGSDWEVLRDFYLENGLVSRIKGDNNTIDYLVEYDSQNQIKRLNGKDGKVDLEFEWKDGNISKVIEYSGGNPSYIYTFDYTEYPNTLRMLPLLIDIGYEDELDPFIIAAGYFGKVSKNLPLTETCTNVSDPESKEKVTTYSYSGFNEAGYPSALTIRNWEDDCRADFVWKK